MGYKDWNDFIEAQRISLLTIHIASLKKAPRLEKPDFQVFMEDMERCKNQLKSQNKFRSNDATANAAWDEYLDNALEHCEHAFVEEYNALGGNEAFIYDDDDESIILGTNAELVYGSNSVPASRLIPTSHPMLDNTQPDSTGWESMDLDLPASVMGAFEDKEQGIT